MSAALFCAFSIELCCACALVVCCWCPMCSEVFDSSAYWCRWGYGCGAVLVGMLVVLFALCRFCFRCCAAIGGCLCYCRPPVHVPSPIRAFRSKHAPASQSAVCHSVHVSQRVRPAACRLNCSIRPSTAPFPTSRMAWSGWTLCGERRAWRRRSSSGLGSTSTPRTGRALWR